MSRNMTTDYLSLVREEFVKRFGEEGSKVSFITVKNPVDENTTQEELREYFMPDTDTPEDTSGVLWIPLSIKAFPKVLKSMTANQAGYWAIQKCHQQDWDFMTKYTCCLNNLEMEI